MDQKEQLQEAFALLNIALADYDSHQAQDKVITEGMELQMGQLIQTRGCSKCGGHHVQDD